MSYSDPLIAAARNLTYFNGLRHESYQLKTALVFDLFALSPRPPFALIDAQDHHGLRRRQTVLARQE